MFEGKFLLKFEVVSSKPSILRIFFQSILGVTHIRVSLKALTLYNTEI